MAEENKSLGSKIASGAWRTTKAIGAGVVGAAMRPLAVELQQATGEVGAGFTSAYAKSMANSSKKADDKIRAAAKSASASGDSQQAVVGQALIEHNRVVAGALTSIDNRLQNMEIMQRNIQTSLNRMMFMIEEVKGVRTLANDNLAQMQGNQNQQNQQNAANQNLLGGGILKRAPGGSAPPRGPSGGATPRPTGGVGAGANAARGVAAGSRLIPALFNPVTGGIVGAAVLAGAAITGSAYLGDKFNEAIGTSEKFKERQKTDDYKDMMQQQEQASVAGRNRGNRGERLKLIEEALKKNGLTQDDVDGFKNDGIIIKGGRGTIDIKTGQFVDNARASSTRPSRPLPVESYDTGSGEGGEQLNVRPPQRSRPMSLLERDMQNRQNNLRASNALVADFARRMGIQGSNFDAQLVDGIPIKINGRDVPENLYTPEQIEKVRAGKALRQSMGAAGPISPQQSEGGYSQVVDQTTNSRGSVLRGYTGIEQSPVFLSPGMTMDQARSSAVQMMYGRNNTSPNPLAAAEQSREQRAGANDVEINGKDVEVTSRGDTDITSQGSMKFESLSSHTIIFKSPHIKFETDKLEFIFKEKIEKQDASSVTGQNNSGGATPSGASPSTPGGGATPSGDAGTGGSGAAGGSTGTGGAGGTGGSRTESGSGASPSGTGGGSTTRADGTPIKRVVQSGSGFNIVELTDGSTVKRTGTRAWRNNNPGNVSYGSFAIKHGALGGDPRFAIFPTYAAGRKAKEALLFDSPSYKGMTISQAIYRYAPPNENNTENYIAKVCQAIGVSPAMAMSALTPEQRKVMLDAMERVEGFREGKTEVLSKGTGAATAGTGASPVTASSPTSPQGAGAASGAAAGTGTTGGSPATPAASGGSSATSMGSSGPSASPSTGGSMPTPASPASPVTSGTGGPTASASAGSAPQNGVTGQTSGTGNAADVAARLSGMSIRGNAGEITQFLRAGGVGLNPQVEAWCAAFVNSALKQVGVTGSGSMVANSFQRWGQQVDPSKVQKGDVVLQTRGKGAGQTGGHVGIATGNIRGNMIEMIAGNTSKSVKTYFVPVNGQLMVRRGSGGQMAGNAERAGDAAAGVGGGAQVSSPAISTTGGASPQGGGRAMGMGASPATGGMGMGAMAGMGGMGGNPLGGIGAMIGGLIGGGRGGGIGGLIGGVAGNLLGNLIGGMGQPGMPTASGMRTPGEPQTSFPASPPEPPRRPTNSFEGMNPPPPPPRPTEFNTNGPEAPNKGERQMAFFAEPPADFFNSTGFTSVTPDPNFYGPGGKSGFSSGRLA